MITYILITLSVLILSFLFHRRQMQKLRNNILNVSSFIENKETKYHLVLELQHGKFTDTRSLSKMYSLFLPKHLSNILHSTFDNDDKALKALQQFKTEIN